MHHGAPVRIHMDGAASLVPEPHDEIVKRRRQCLKRSTYVLYDVFSPDITAAHRAGRRCSPGRRRESDCCGPIIRRLQSSNKCSVPPVPTKERMDWKDTGIVMQDWADHFGRRNQVSLRSRSEIDYDKKWKETGGSLIYDVLCYFSVLVRFLLDARLARPKA